MTSANYDWPSRRSPADSWQRHIDGWPPWRRGPGHSMVQPITGWGFARHLAAAPTPHSAAFARLPEGFVFDPVGAYHEAKANLSQGRLRAAERRLEEALARGGPGLDRIRDLLSEIYQIEVRFDDAKLLLRASIGDAKDPIRVLKELSNLEMDRLPYEGLQGALEKAGQLAPEDDRVWLGKGRLAIEAGRWDEARGWLSRCKRGLADAAVWRAWIALARGSGRPDEALEAARQLGSGNIDLGERRRAARRGCTNKAAMRGQRLPRSSNGSGSNPRTRGRWSASPSWPSGPASPIGSPICGTARPRSSGRLRPTGSSSGAKSLPAGRPSGSSWPAGRTPAVAGLRRAFCMRGPLPPI